MHPDLAVPILITVVSGLAVPALGLPYDLNDQCSLTMSSTVSTTAVGSLIGDYDAESNPQGTQTRLGLWGGSGNNPIPLEMTTTMAIDGTTTPTGVIDLHIDPSIGLATITELDWDVTNGESLPATVSATVLYESFNTVNPTSVFPGGVPIDIPLGEGQVTEASLVQTGQWVGPADPIDGQPGAHRIVATVPCDLNMVVMLDDDTETPLTSPIVLYIDGVHQVGDAADFFTMTATWSEQVEEELPGEPLPTIPMDLPTVVPPGNTAHVLLNLTPETVATDVSIDADIQATRINHVPGDINGDGYVGSDDLLAVLAAWGPCDASCPEDLDGNGVVGVPDLLLLLEYWTV